MLYAFYWNFRVFKFNRPVIRKLLSLVGYFKLF